MRSYGLQPHCTSGRKRRLRDCRRAQQRSGPAKHVPPSPRAGRAVVECVGEQDAHGDACLVEGHQHSPSGPPARTRDAAGHGGEGDGKSQPPSGPRRSQARELARPRLRLPANSTKLLPRMACFRPWVVDEAAPHQGGQESSPRAGCPPGAPAVSSSARNQAAAAAGPRA